MLAGGEHTAAPLALFQDHPRLSSRSPHAASSQRKTFNWVINYITNKTPSWFLPSLISFTFFLSEAALKVFTSGVGVCWCAADGKSVSCDLSLAVLTFIFLFCWLTSIDWTLPETRVSWSASWLCRVHFSSYGSLHTWKGKVKAVTHSFETKKKKRKG